MNNFIWLVILVLIILFVSNGNVLEGYSTIHGNKFWNFWNTPDYLRLRKYPLWNNIYWGPSYWPGGINLR